MKNVQISQDLFCDLILYHLYNNPSAEEAIRREQARQRYLESIGMPADFRW